MFASIVAPVIVGLFLPTTDVQILSQKDFVKVVCSGDVCPEKKTWIDQGYTCSSTVVVWCYKDVTGSGTPEALQAIEKEVAAPWENYQLEMYEPRSAPDLTFNAGFLWQWQIDQKVWLSNEKNNISLVTYNVIATRNIDDAQVNFQFEDETEGAVDLTLKIDPSSDDLWREQTVEQGSMVHYLKSAVRLRWKKQP